MEKPTGRQRDTAKARLRELQKRDLGNMGLVQPGKPLARMFKKDIHIHGTYYHLKFDVPFMYKLAPQKISIWRGNTNACWKYSINAVTGPNDYETREEATEAAIESVKKIVEIFDSITYEDLTPDL